MTARGAAHREAMRAALDVFGEDGKHLVVLGGCALGIYARAEGAPLRATKDVDCLSTLRPWILQEQIIARRCAEGRLLPDMKTSFRYVIAGSDVVVDILSPEGLNVGGSVRWLREAAEKSETFLVDGVPIRAVTPAYFLLLKLSAFIDRGEDLASAKDLEDIVCLATEVDDLVAQVSAAGLRGEVAALFKAALTKHQADASYVPDIVEFHLHPLDAHRRELVTSALAALATGS